MNHSTVFRGGTLNFEPSRVPPAAVRSKFNVRCSMLQRFNAYALWFDGVDTPSPRVLRSAPTGYEYISQSAGARAQPLMAGGQHLHRPTRPLAVVRRARPGCLECRRRFFPNL